MKERESREASAPEALPPDLEEWFAAERRRAPPSPSIREGIRRGVERSLRGTPTPPPLRAAIDVQSPSFRTVAAATIGIALGAGGHALLSGRGGTSSPSIVIEGAVAPTSAVTPSVAPPRAASDAAVPAALIIEDAASARPAQASASVLPRAGRGALEEERSLLERARTALLRRDARAALEAVSLHQRRFSRGALREERELVRVRALVLDGRLEEAHAAFDQFAHEEPSSPLLPLIRRAAREAVTTPAAAPQTDP